MTCKKTIQDFYLNKAYPKAQNVITTPPKDLFTQGTFALVGTMWKTDKKNLVDYGYGAACWIAMIPVALISGVMGLALLCAIAITHPFVYAIGALLDVFFDNQSEKTTTIRPG